MSLKKSTLNLSVKALQKKVNNGEFVFDNAIQRKLCWDNGKKSLLIHSLVEGYPIPPLYSKRATNEEGKTYYDMLDGKQRSNAIVSFLNGDYKLEELPPVMLEDGTVVDMSGKYFSELEEDIQSEIKDSMLTVYFFEDLSNDEVCEMFFRLNNGKAMTAIEISRTRAKSREKITELGKLSIFGEALTQKMIDNYANEDIIIKSLLLLYRDKKALDSKEVREFLSTLEITEEMEKVVTDVFDRLHEVHELILLNDESSLAKKIAKKIYTRTHLISLVPVTKKSLDEEYDIELYADWVKSFFNGQDGATSISAEYNSVCQQGANKESSVKIRLEELEKDYIRFSKIPM